MTTDTPSTSGEGVDVLRAVKHVLTQQPYTRGNRPPSANQIYAHENFHKVHKRIAELIEAASILADPEEIDIDGSRMRRLCKALAACRATQGAHR